MMWLVAQLGRLLFRKEAMGMGDVFLLGAIGAFFGWKAVLFNIIASSFAGSIVGVTLIALSKQELGRHIPFGPYMALGVLAWMFEGVRTSSSTPIGLRVPSLILPPCFIGIAHRMIRMRSCLRSWRIFLKACCPV